MKAQYKNPPTLAKWLISKVVKDVYQEEFFGDLKEVYDERIEKNGLFRAKFMYWVDALHLIKGFYSISLFKTQNDNSTVIMINYFLRMFYRGLLKNKLFSIINILGLAFGLTCSVLISLWVWDELSYDQFHTNGDTIYRVLGDVNNNGQSKIREYIPSAMVQPMLDEFPEIIEITRVFYSTVMFEKDKTKFSESGIYADSSILSIFTLPLNEGKLEKILSEPNTIVISKKLADKYFPNESALGKHINIVEKGKQNYVVSGVFNAIPRQSSLQFDFIMSYSRFEDEYRPWWNSNSSKYAYTNFNVHSYLTLIPEIDLAVFNSKLDLFIRNHSGLDTDDAMFAFPFNQYYLHDDFSAGRNPTGKIQSVNFLSLIAILILLIACINFMNLSTASASKRAKEISLRKTIGATRSQLMTQFIMESMLLSIIAMAIALIAVNLLLPVFNSITDKYIEIPFGSPAFILGILATAIITGVFAGYYPAFYMSAFSPSKAIKEASANNKLSGIRSILVVLQFTMAIAFIVYTLVVSNQIDFMQKKDLGIKKENILFHSLHEVGKHKEAYKKDLLSINGVRTVGFSEHNPLSTANGNRGVSWPGKPENSEIYFNVMQVGRGLVETFEIELIEGTGFPEIYSANANKNFIINESAAIAMMAKDPIGMELKVWGFDGKIVGVARDFHHNSLKHAIEPVVILYNPEQTFMAYIGVESNNMPALLSNIQDVYSKYETEYSFDFSFVEDQYKSSYGDVTTIGRLTKMFSIAAIFISCLGLFGLSAFITEQRTKEVGIRKVLGASELSLLYLFSSGFVKLVLIAFIIAAPLAWFYARYWLADYAYRIDLDVLPFATAGFMAIFIALITVTYNTFKAAKGNPVDSLKYE
jgi:putative ABC transport system permease protein